MYFAIKDSPVTDLQNTAVAELLETYFKKCKAQK